MKILVSGASGIVGYGILKSLRNCSSKHKLIGTTIYDDSIAPVFCDVVEKVLPTSDPEYIDDLIEIIHKHGVDAIISGIECDMYSWNNNRDKLSEVTIPVLNNRTLINLCSDKLLFQQVLRINNWAYAIDTAEVRDNRFFYPYLYKPRHGFGSKGIIKVMSREYESIVGEVSGNMIVQPIIGSDDEEYTVSGFFDKRSNLIDYFPLRRKLSKDGFTQQAIVEDRGFGEILEELAETFNPIGPTNFQFRFDKDQAKLLEINPRISSATSIRSLLGYNEAEMSVNYFLHNIIPKSFNKSELIGKKAIRYTEDFIF